MMTSSFAQPEPDVAREWEKTEVARIQRNYKAPTLRVATLGDLRAVVVFDLKSNGQVTNVHSIRKSDGPSANVTIPEREFRVVEKALISAVKRSSPFQVPTSRTERQWRAVYTYEPNSKPAESLSLVARGKHDY